jgi:hypothetical protein
MKDSGHKFALISGRFAGGRLSRGVRAALPRVAPGPTTACGVPTMIGQPGTVAAAAAEQEFIAFRRGLSPEVAGEFAPPQVDGTERRYASLIAERLVLQGGLQRARSWPAAQRDVQGVDVVRGGHAEMAATYVHVEPQRIHGAPGHQLRDRPVGGDNGHDTGVPGQFALSRGRLRTGSRC